MPSAIKIAVIALYLFSSLIFTAFVLVGIAHADDLSAAVAVNEFAIDINSPLAALAAFLFAALGGIISFIIKLLFGKKGKVVKLEDEHVAYLTNAAVAGLRLAEEKVNSLVSNVKDPTVKTEMIADAVNYVLQSIPGLLKKANISPVIVRAFVERELTERAGVTNVEAAGSATAPANE